MRKLDLNSRIGDSLLVLGLDTSCYTTSLALVNLQGALVAEKRRMLEVPSGERGLAQSEALFQHSRRLPELLEDLLDAGRDRVRSDNPARVIAAVCASTRPRPSGGSYMPVFTVSEGYGRALAAGLGVPFYGVSHQEGHIMAGLWSSEVRVSGTFLALHLSGGTSEVLLVRPQLDPGGGIESFGEEVLGGTSDINAGQLVDRVGVMLGLPFPCGPQLEVLAVKACGQAGKGEGNGLPGEEAADREAGGNGERCSGPARGLSLPASVRGYRFSFSGAETAARRLRERGVAPGLIARAVERCLANTLEKVIRRAVLEQQVYDILLVGGVAANGFIRQRLRRRLEHPAVGARLLFAESRYSPDNAVGVAILGLTRLLSEKNSGWKPGPGEE